MQLKVVTVMCVQLKDLKCVMIYPQIGHEIENEKLAGKTWYFEKEFNDIAFPFL